MEGQGLGYGWAPRGLLCDARGAARRRCSHSPPTLLTVLARRSPAGIQLSRGGRGRARGRGPVGADRAADSLPREYDRREGSRTFLFSMQRQRQVDMRGEWSDPRRVAIMRGGWCEALLPARSMPRDDVAVVGGRHSMGRSAVGQVEGESRRCRPPGQRLKPPPPSLPLPTRRRH